MRDMIDGLKEDISSALGILDSAMDLLAACPIISIKLVNLFLYFKFKVRFIQAMKN